MMENIRSDEVINLNSEDYLNLKEFDSEIYLLEK